MSEILKSISIVDRAIFEDYLEDARSCTRRGYLVGTKVDPLDSLRDYTCFLGGDGTYGGAVRSDGEICHGFNVGTHKGAGKICQVVRIGYTIARGQVPTTFCFEDLASYYERIGWVPTDEAPWDDSYAPVGWDYELQGRPSVVWLYFPKVNRELLIGPAYQYGLKLYGEQSLSTRLNYRNNKGE